MDNQKLRKLYLEAFQDKLVKLINDFQAYDPGEVLLSVAQGYYRHEAKRIITNNLNQEVLLYKSPEELEKMPIEEKFLATFKDPDQKG